MQQPAPAPSLPDGIRARFVDNGNGLSMHLLEAGDAGRPLVILLHGFPELAYSWRKLMLPLAAAGYHVVAPDQRGYGRTTGWDADYDGDVASFRLLNLVRDTIGLVDALGANQVACIVGHDFGASVAGNCALIRPDIFRALCLMTPFAGAPPLKKPAPASDIHADLASLARPRKHYHWYYSTREANDDMWHAPQGMHDFLRAYFHAKSADWANNHPHKLAGWTATDLAKMPTYYIMDLDQGMAATVAQEMPSAEVIAACTWLRDDELAFYAATYSATGFQGGLHWYRCRTGPWNADLEVFAGRTIDVPSCFIGGAADWGVFQMPGAFEKMQSSVCTDMRFVDLLDGAGHWVQQEKTVEVMHLLLRFLRTL
ncbi:alpha/beta hydrolase [Roseiterribacter gracilis]|uniref:Alpha/beta hydrolase n=1 Tax=Roseiterribacter gracilis TaxID=2812848 RepID=A0A8S8X6V9_9PROT|nr:alpha/beta hydrolase [Rhodospirillales bacterium TMPK1]